ncbi:hypothetical protein VRK_17790 [Vibrio sp. MEBiC08052]|nr:hypothetical protein VRK_17790 [Vibrio sp. MEBiC08052]
MNLTVDVTAPKHFYSANQQHIGFIVNSVCQPSDLRQLFY